ncbi:MAG: aminoglycoside phosphotransferase family protein [bacterium]
MECLEGYLITINMRKTKKLYEQLARTLKKLHNLNINTTIPDVNMFDLFEKSLSLLAQKKIDDRTKPIIEKIADNFKREKAMLDLNLVFANTVVCHNDLSPKNLIYKNNEFRLIDAYITRGDLFYDLATIIVFWCFDKSSEKMLLDSYFERELTPEENRKLSVFKKLAMQLYAIRLLCDCTGESTLSIDTTNKRTLLEFLSTNNNIISDKQILKFASILINQSI